MFEVRVHRVSENDAVNKRKLWEGWLQWANRFSNIDSDNIARNQFGRDDFEIDAFLELFSAGLDASESGGLVSNETGTIVSASKKIESLDVFADYWVNWSLTLKSSSGPCRFVAGVPFIGREIISSAQDIKAEMGWFNNSNITEAASRGPEWNSVIEGENTPYEFVYEDWESFGKHGWTRLTASFGTGTKTKITSQVLRLDGTQRDAEIYYHLSGSGAATLGRITGNIGIMLFCQPSSRFQIISSRLTLHRRNR